MTPWKYLPILLSALLCTASCDLGTSPTTGGGTEGEGLTGRLQDPGGRPIAGVLVRVFPDANVNASLAKTAAAAEAVFDSIYSDSRGFFRFKGLPSGNYGLRTYTRRGDTTLVLILRRIPYGGGKKSLGTQTLVVGGKLTMQVQVSATGTPGPLQGARCEIVGLPLSVEADETGLCVLDALPPGQYAVRLWYPGYDEVVTAPIEVRPGQSAGKGPWRLVPSTQGPAPRYAATSGTLAHWTFDSLHGGSTYPDLGPNGFDLKTSGPVTQTTSPHGKALTFDGTSYLSTQGTVAALSGKLGRYLTLEARVRLSQYPSPLNRDSAAAVLGTTRGYSLLVRTNGGLAVAAPNDTGAAWNLGAAWSAPGVVPLNQWVDLAISIDKQTLQVYGFVNGVAVRLYNRNGVIPNGPEAEYAFHVGQVPETDRPFKGEIDEVRVSDSLVLGLGLPLARTDSAVVAYPRVQTYAVADAGLSYSVPGNPDVNSLANLNSGIDDHFAVGTYDMASSYRGLVRFSLPKGIAPSAINRAVIRLRVHSWVTKNATGKVRIDAHRVLKEWKEGLGRGTGYANSAGLNGATARECYWTSGGAALWNKVFVGLDSVDASSVPAASAMIQPLTGTVIEWDVTGLAREWAMDTTKNFGVLLASAFPAGNGAVMDFPRLHTREAAVDSLRPLLIINGPAIVPPAENYDSSLVAHWDFEGNNSVKVRDVLGRHDGTFYGAASVHDGFESNLSGEFNGSAYVKIPASSRFSGLSDFTLSAMVWQDVQSIDEPVIEFSNRDTLGLHMWVNTAGDQSVIPGQLYVNTMTDRQDFALLSGTPGLLQKARWNRIAYTYSAATRLMRLYANGVLVAQGTLAPGGKPALSGDLYLGYRPLDSKVGRKGASFHGHIDDVKIWSRALPASELR